MPSRRQRLAVFGLVLGSVVAGGNALAASSAPGRGPWHDGGLGSLDASDGGSCSSGGTVSSTLAWSRCQTVSTYDFVAGTTCDVSFVVCLPEV